MARGKGDDHTKEAMKNRERIYSVLWETGYGWGGLTFMQIVAKTGLAELTVRRRLKELVTEGRVIRRTGGYRADWLKKVLFLAPSIEYVTMSCDNQIVTVPLPKQETGSIFARLQEEANNHARGSLARSLNKIAHGTDLPDPSKRVYYTTASRILPSNEGMDELIRRAKPGKAPALRE